MIRFFKLYVLALFLFLSFSGFAQEEQHLFHDELKRSWILYAPTNYSTDQLYPLVIVLHGGGGNPRQLMNNTRKRFNQLADQENFIVVYPEGLGKSWNDNNIRERKGYARKENIDDVGFISKMIVQIESEYNINSFAIFSCGISNGGLMSQTLAMELPNKIKAIGMVAANFGADQMEGVSNIPSFPVLFIHGTHDTILPYEAGEITVFNQNRGRVMGINNSIALMADINGNSLTSSASDIENKNDDCCTSQHLKYPNSKNPNLKIELIKVNNGGHTWPGAKVQPLIAKTVGPTTQDFNACDKLWGFFSSLIE